MMRKLRKLALAAVWDSPFEHVLRTTLARLSLAQKDRYDRELDAVMTSALRPDSNCVDVGCYRGEVLRRILKLAPRGKHFAIEPVRENHAYLARKFPAARIFNMALSDYSGRAAFQHVVDRPARSGLLKVDYPDPRQEVREVSIDVGTLDGVIPAGVRIDFIKIDVEGAELAVLRGGRKLIRKYQPMIAFEHGYERARTYGDTPEHMYDLLAGELGLRIALMKSWLRGHGDMRRDEFLRHVYDKLDFSFLAYSSVPHLTTPSRGGRRAAAQGPQSSTWG